MAVLAVGMADSVTAMDPRIVLPAIFRLRGQYWIVCALLAAVVLTSWLLQDLLESALPIPVLPAVFSGFASLYFIATAMRAGVVPTI